MPTWPHTATCVHGVLQERADGRWFEKPSPCAACEETRLQLKREVEAAEVVLRERLSTDDPLHPDNYRGPWGMLWSQAVSWLLAEPESSQLS